MREDACSALGHALLILLLSSVALAQSAETPSALPSSDAMAAKFTAGLVASLGLTDAQAPRVEGAVTEMIERQRKILGGHAGDGDSFDQASLRALQEELKQSQQQAHTDLSDVLTEEQLAGFDEAVQEQRAQVVGEAVVMRLGEPLGLTDDQSEQLEPIFAKNIQARSEMMQEIRGQGRTFGGMRTIRTKMQELQKSLEDQLRPILTEEQMKSYLGIAEKTRSQMRERAGGQRRR
jgi:hypothetical protein